MKGPNDFINRLKNKTILASVILATTLETTALTAAKKQTLTHQWQTGKVLDTSQRRLYAGTSADDWGFGVSTTARYVDIHTNTIQVGPYLYVAQTRWLFSWLVVNSTATVAIENGKMHLPAPSGKVHEAVIVKTILQEEKE